MPPESTLRSTMLETEVVLLAAAAVAGIVLDAYRALSYEPIVLTRWIRRFGCPPVRRLTD